MDLVIQKSLEKALSDAGVVQVTSDSRKAGPGVAFVATPSVTPGSPDGHDFIEAAIQAGSPLCVGEGSVSPGVIKEGLSISYLKVPDSRLALAYAAAHLADHPSRKMLCFGVTGTSGKTTTTFLLESILKSAGMRVGLIGTVAFRFGDQVLDATHTTPGAPELQSILSKMQKSGCDALVMEVSSHALKQKRADFIAFDAVGFTNLSREHLDYHPDMEDYFGSKARLFKELFEQSRSVGKAPCAVVNTETDWGKKLLAETSEKNRTKIFGISSAELNAIQDLEGIRAVYRGQKFQSKLIGDFNVSNIALAMEMAFRAGISVEHCIQGIESISGVPGRLERVPNTHGFAVCVDYAHKPDALEKVLKTIRPSLEAGQGKLITVFGCGGDRDRTKRPVMGRLAEVYSDCVVITSDNPRTEDPDQIIAEVVAGISREGLEDKVQIEPDRARAIHWAIGIAQAGDFVLIAGKGHEDYQILGTQKVHFDDREVAAAALKARGAE